MGHYPSGPVLGNGLAPSSVQRCYPSPNVTSNCCVPTIFLPTWPTGSLLPFRRIFWSQRTIILSVRLPNGICFLRLPLPAKPFPSLAVWIPQNTKRGLTGLPRSHPSTFFGVFREALFPGRTTNGLAVSKKHRQLAACHFGPGVVRLIFNGSNHLSPVIYYEVYHAFALWLPMGSTGLLPHDLVVDRRATLSRELRTPPLPAAHVPVAINGHLVNWFMGHRLPCPRFDG